MWKMRNNSSDSFGSRAPILVLGLGNTLLGDDGFGPAVINQFLQEQEEDLWEGRAEFLDGGTQGLALLGPLSEREAVIIADVVTTGAAAGNIRILDLSEILQMGVRRAGNSHEGNAGELLAVAKILGELPGKVFVVGLEPETIATGYGLSEPARRALPIAASRVRDLLTELIANV
jgi:hydrogenase maturation protease